MARIIDYEYDSDSVLIAVTVEDDGDVASFNREDASLLATITELKEENEKIRQNNISTSAYYEIHHVMREIVLCKNCKCHGTSECVMEGGELDPTLDEDFCSYGEKKDS